MERIALRNGKTFVHATGRIYGSGCLRRMIRYLENRLITIEPTRGGLPGSRLPPSAPPPGNDQSVNC